MGTLHVSAAIALRLWPDCGSLVPREKDRTPGEARPLGGKNTA